MMLATQAGHHWLERTFALGEMWVLGNKQSKSQLHAHPLTRANDTGLCQQDSTQYWAKPCCFSFWHAIRSSVHFCVSLYVKDIDTLEQGEWEAAAWAGDLHMLCSRRMWMYSEKWVMPECQSYCYLPLLLGEWNWNLGGIH